MSDAAWAPSMIVAMPARTLDDFSDAKSMMMLRPGLEGRFGESLGRIPCLTYRSMLDMAWAFKL